MALPDGTKPLPEPMLTYHLLSFIPDIVLLHTQDIDIQDAFEICTFEIMATADDLPGHNELP